MNLSHDDDDEARGRVDDKTIHQVIDRKNADSNSPSTVSASGDDDLGDVTNTPEDTVSSLMKRILKRSTMALAALAIIGGIVGYVLASTLGMLSAVVAFALLLIFCLMTPAVFAGLSRETVTFSLMAICILISWLIKIVIVILALIALRSATWFDHQIFAIEVVIGAIVIISIEAHAVLTSRFPYVTHK